MLRGGGSNGLDPFEPVGLLIIPTSLSIVIILCESFALLPCMTLLSNIYLSEFVITQYSTSL